jgi:hypothetical protein
MFKTRRFIAALGLPLLAVACHEDASQPLGPGAEPTLPRTAPAPRADRAGPAQQSVVRLERVGEPIWRPVDFHVFSAPIGTPETGFEEFVTTALSLLPPPNHRLHPQLLVGPGDPHAAPYDKELAQGVAALGFEERRVFGASEFTGVNGIYLVWMVVPDPGTTGSSPDFASGPIIPNTLFPITITGVSTRNNELFDAALANSTVPALNDPSLTPPFDVEGHSHFPFFIAEATIFGPGDVGPAGNYKYTISMTDQEGNGWTIHAHYVVKAKG